MRNGTALIIVIVLLGVGVDSVPRGHAKSSTLGRQVEEPDAILTLTVAADRVESQRMMFTAEIVGGPDNNPDLYCVESTWSFGDGPPLTVSPSCMPWSSNVTIPRRFEVVHTYATSGTYEAVFVYGPLIARAAVEVRDRSSAGVGTRPAVSCSGREVSKTAHE